MYRHKQRHQSVEHESLDRWLVSYADYMTLMFALFVVLYAMAMVKEEEYQVLSETLGTVFEVKGNQGKGVKGEGILTDNAPVDTSFELYGTALQEEKSAEILDEEVQLSEVDEKNTGKPLAAMEQSLTNALYDLKENGYLKLERNDDWLLISLDNRLLFAAGSASLISSASVVLKEISQVIGPIDNFIRVRGYTDNTPIKTEFFNSNWELSAARSMAVLKQLVALDIDPARMAIEGYGEFSPSSDNSTQQGRLENRKVVLAISKYQLVKTLPPITENTPVSQATAVETLAQKNGKENTKESAEDYDTVQVIKLPNGGIRVTTRRDPQLQPNLDNIQE